MRKNERKQERITNRAYSREQKRKRGGGSRSFCRVYINAVGQRKNKNEAALPTFKDKIPSLLFLTSNEAGIGEPVVSVLNVIKKYDA